MTEKKGRVSFQVILDEISASFNLGEGLGVKHTLF